MAHIIIKNIGPIKEVELDLNKINVFMGPQSSGKSTIVANEVTSSGNFIVTPCL